MTPIEFPEQTTILDKPSSMTDEECFSLPVFSDGSTCISVWKLNWKERLVVLLFGKLWLGVYSGVTQPPVFISTKSVFIKSK
jgi:hypothetical protein